ncbi:MAG: RdgB/HAM1 family non-canonical purine NTP pyrophosphatase [Kiritimatiellia bacterium]
MRIIIASGNPHKIKEIQSLLFRAGVEWLTPADAPGAPEPEETGATFAENAAIKARALAAHAGCPALADDSGLEVDALDGAPGVRSARYAGRHGDDAANNRLLLEKLRGGRNRRARFRCALALAAPDGTILATAGGACEGTIATEARGASGFGYDPLFIPDGHTRTFAELGAEVKNRLSHRARALEEAGRTWGLPAE